MRKGQIDDGGGFRRRTRTARRRPRRARGPGARGPRRHGLPAGREAITGAFWDQIVRNDVRIWLTDEVIVCGNEAMALLACEVGPPDHRRRMSPVVDHLVSDAQGRIAAVRGFYNLMR
jgi:hypothetical protein